MMILRAVACNGLILQMRRLSQMPRAPAAGGMHTEPAQLLRPEGFYQLSPDPRGCDFPSPEAVRDPAGTSSMAAYGGYWGL